MSRGTCSRRLCGRGRRREAGTAEDRHEVVERVARRARKQVRRGGRRCEHGRGGEPGRLALVRDVVVEVEQVLCLLPCGNRLQCLLCGETLVSQPRVGVGKF